MPKRKRMSFTVKRRRASSTPVKQSQPTPPTKRSRGRPPKGAVPAAAAAAAAAPRKRQKKGGDAGKRREDAEAEAEVEEDLEIEDEGEEEGDEAEIEQSELDDPDDVEEGQDQDHEMEEEEEDGDEEEGEEEGEGEDDDGDDEEEKEEEEEAEERTRARSSSATARAKPSSRKNNPRPQVSESGQTIAYVPKSTIEKKWTRLDSESQSAIRGVLAAAARPAIASHLDAAAVAGEQTGRGAEAQAAVRRAVRSVERRLSKMPFPPRTEAAMFEYEGLLRDNGMLKRRVRAQADDFALLQRELARVREDTESADAEAASLEREYETERRAREKRVGGKLGYLLVVPDVEPADSARKIRLAPRPNGGGGGGGGGELRGDGESEEKKQKIGLSAGAAAVEEVDKAKLTDEARELLEQLQDHLDGSPRAAADWALARDIDRAEEVIDRLLVARRRPQVQVDKLASG